VRPYFENIQHKKGLVEWLKLWSAITSKCETLSSKSSAAKKEGLVQVCVAGSEDCSTVGHTCNKPAKVVSGFHNQDTLSRTQMETDLKTY
jgi:hypothetical protein